MNATPDVWQDAQLTDGGLSVITYTQQADDEPQVVGESYWTWTEMAVLLDENSDYEVSP